MILYSYLQRFSDYFLVGKTTFWLLLGNKLAKSVKEYERLKSPKSKGLQEFARIANGAKVIPNDEIAW